MAVGARQEDTLILSMLDIGKGWGGGQYVAYLAYYCSAVIMAYAGWEF